MRPFDWVCMPLQTACDSDEYVKTKRAAFAMLALWPVGVPLLYALLLWASRDALRTETETPLSKATAFLSADYRPSAFWWEPLEMCRKLTLTGWVLLIGEESEQARVLVALLVSITFLATQLAVKPLRRCVRLGSNYRLTPPPSDARRVILARYAQVRGQCAHVIRGVG